MDRLDIADSSLRTFHRAFGLFALMLLGTTAIACWLVLLLPPVFSVLGQALLGATLVAAVCLPLLWYGMSRLMVDGTSAQRLQAEQLIDHAPEGILTINSRGQILSLNPAAEGYFGYREEEMVNKPITSLLADPPKSGRQNFLHESLPLGSILGLAAGAREVIGKRKNGETFPLELTGSSITLGDQSFSVAFARDISKRKRAQRYLMAHYAATCILAEARSLPEALPRLLEAVCQALGWEVSAYWGFDASTNVLRCEQVYQAAHVVLPISLDTGSLTCKSGEGLAGRAWASGKPAWVDDVQQQKGWPCQALAVPLHLRGALAIPIVLGKQVFGVLTLFSCARLRRDDQLQDVMGELGKQLCQFIARKRDELRLHQSEERFRQLAENIHQVFWMADAKDESILYLSPSVEEVWGRPAEAFKGQLQTFLEFVDPEDRNRVLEALEKQKLGESTSEEYRVLHPDGSVRWVWDRAFPIRDSQGLVYRIAGITADITKRRHTDAVLRKTTETLQALVQAAPMAIILIDLQGKVQLWNPAAQRIFGWTEAEVLGHPLPALSIEESGGSGEQMPTILHRNKSYHGLPTRCRRKDGTTVEVSLSAAPLRDPAGTIFGSMAILMDLTEQKRLEDQLRQAQKMEAIGQLAGGVAHDFNNLLTVITGYSEFLLGEMEPGKRDHGLVEQIKKAGDRAAALTRQLLAFSRKQLLQVRIVDLNALVQELGKMLHRLIGEDVELIIQQDPLLGRIKADPGQIEQMLMNLATNARDAMPEGGSLTIATANYLGKPGTWAEATELEPRPYVLLTVRDTGSGMDEATKSRIFEPFFTTKEVGKGTGLGLAMVYGIVKHNGGHIEVDSQPGKGTTFRIYLPRLEEAHESLHDPKHTTDSLRGTETILLVEDEPSVRNLLGQVLGMSGYTVLEARSGEEALSVMEKHGRSIAVLVTDVIMPGMNGKQLSERARVFQPNLKVLYMSGYSDKVLDTRSIVAPGTGFLPKPISQADLNRKIRELLDGTNGKSAGLIGRR